jgi:GNAT superfamily N-acetyltransferase
MEMWNVELAKTDEADEIANLYNRVWERYEGILPELLLKDRMPDKNQIIKWMKSKIYFIVRNEERIIGVVRCSIDHGTCLLDRMAVDENFRKKGIGTDLTKRVIKYANEKNALKVWLDSTPILVDAISLYKKMGFKECGHLKKHYWGEDIKFFELLIE